MDGYLPVNFIVRDNGIGMSQEFVDKQLFHEFEQENPDEGDNQGTGLGLFIAQHLIRLMDGKGNRYRISDFHALPDRIRYTRGITDRRR